jgi:hypothetical protein
LRERDPFILFHGEKDREFLPPPCLRSDLWSQDGKSGSSSRRRAINIDINRRKNSYPAMIFSISLLIEEKNLTQP